MEKLLSADEARELLKDMPDWKLNNDKTTLTREYAMKDFIAAVALIDQIAQIAQREDHHPDLHLTNYRKLRIELSSHDAGGLTKRDFIVAAAISALTAAVPA